jgi:hypothetical protein
MFGVISITLPIFILISLGPASTRLLAKAGKLGAYTNSR